MTETTSTGADTSSETTATAVVQQEAAVAAGDGREGESVVGDDGGRQEAARRVETRREEHGDADALRREAAARRRQLRSVERERDDLAADRDRLAARLDRQDRAEVERLAAERLHDPADVWHDGVDLAELRDDDGEIDPEKVRAALDHVAERHPHWAKRTTTPGRTPIWPAGAQAPTPGPTSFGERLKQAVQGE